MADKVKRIKRGGSKIGRQHTNHAEKYKRQFYRTEANLRRKGKTNKKKRGGERL